MLFQVLCQLLRRRNIKERLYGGIGNALFSLHVNHETSRTTFSKSLLIDFSKFTKLSLDTPFVVAMPLKLLWFQNSMVLVSKFGYIVATTRWLCKWLFHGYCICFGAWCPYNEVWASTKISTFIDGLDISAYVILEHNKHLWVHFYESLFEKFIWSHCYSTFSSCLEST